MRSFKKNDDDDDDDDGKLMVGDLLGVVSGHRDTTVPKLIANCFAEIRNWGRC